MHTMRNASEISFEGLRAVLSWSPTGVVIYKTPAGWQARKDTAVVVAENARTPRVWKDLNRAVASLNALGVKNAQIEMA